MSDELWTEVRVSFADSLVEVAHLRPGQSFTIGECADADLVCAIPGLHRLVMATASGAVIEDPDSRALESVGLGESARLELGNLSVEISCQAALVPVLRRRPIDHGWWLSVLGSALALVPILALALRAAEYELPPLETDPALGLAYMVRSEPGSAEPTRDRRRPPPPEPEQRERRRPAASPREIPVWAPPAHPSETETEAETGPESEAADWPGPVDILQAARARGSSGPQPVVAMLQRDSSPVEAASRGGLLGAMPSEEELEDFVAVSAAAFGAGVDDRALWAAMTDGPLDTTVAGLELTGSGRGGGSATGVIRSDAPQRPSGPPASPSALRRSTLASAAPLRARLLSTRVEGELDRQQAQRLARALSDEWIECVEAAELPLEFELRYTVARGGQLRRVELGQTRLPAPARRCIIAAVEASPGFGSPSRGATVEQRVAIGPSHGTSR